MPFRWQEVKRNASNAVKTEFAEAFKVGDEAIDGITVTPNGARVTVVMKRPASLDTGGLVVNKPVKAITTLAAGDPDSPEAAAQGRK